MVTRKTTSIKAKLQNQIKGQTKQKTVAVQCQN